MFCNTLLRNILGFLCEKFWSNLMFSNAQLCHRLSWGHQRSAIEFWKTIWSLLICSVLIERIEITYQRGIPDTSFTCLHLTGITSTARKTNGIPIWHSVKKNDVKIATIGWQLHCRQIHSKFFQFWNYKTWYKVIEHYTVIWFEPKLFIH